MKRRSRRAAIALSVLAVLAAQASAGSWLDEEASGVLGTGTGAAVADIQRRFGADARILSIAIDEAGTSIAVQDPAVRAHVDRHRYEADGSVSREPVAVGRSERRLRARLFRLSEVDPAVIPRILAAATAAVDTEGGAATHVLLDRSEGSGDVVSWGSPRWRVYVEGPRGGGYVEFDLKGDRKRVVRW